MAIQRVPHGRVDEIVQAVNAKGINVEGTSYRSHGGGLWPTRGQQVTLLLDGDWLVDVEFHDDGRQQATVALSATTRPLAARMP